MKFSVFLLIILLFSCGYPDIDSVPVFDDINISKEESIDLCNLTITDKKLLTDCINNITD